MNNHINSYLKDFEFNDPTVLEAIQGVEKQIQFNLPKDYSDFLINSNGGEGEVGQSYLRLWQLEELIELNEDYGVEDFAPGLLIIGTDGGDTAYCIDTRSDDKPYVSVPFIGMDLSEVQRCGNNLNEFFNFLYGN